MTGTVGSLLAALLILVTINGCDGKSADGPAAAVAASDLTLRLGETKDAISQSLAAKFPEMHVLSRKVCLKLVDFDAVALGGRSQLLIGYDRKGRTAEFGVLETVDKVVQTGEKYRAVSDKNPTAAGIQYERGARIDRGELLLEQTLFSYFQVTSDADDARSATSHIRPLGENRSFVWQEDSAEKITRMYFLDRGAAGAVVHPDGTFTLRYDQNN